MKHALHVGQLQRLRKIEGQVRGIARMVEDERYCVDILTQLRAARAALRRVEDSVLAHHATGNDLSRWIASVFADQPLASAVASAEHQLARHWIPVSEARERILSAVSRRYPG